MRETAVGIDLGTTNSAVAWISEAGLPEIVPNALGGRITPSVLFFGDPPVLIGQEAKEMQGLGKEDIASFFKRSMGDPDFALTFDGRDYSSTDLSAILLTGMKRDAEANLRCEITHAVITVPAYFNDAQRRATMDAGKQAGITVEFIVNEPTAAALAYGVKRVANRGNSDAKLLVYDLGGGTFDVTLMTLTPDGLSVIATDGDSKLGGKDWDDRVINFLASRFNDEHGVDPMADAVTFHDLLVRCEQAKKDLSDRKSTKISIHHEGLRGTYELTRDKFAELTRDLMEQTQALAEEVLSSQDLRWGDLGGVLLVGGSTRMPMVVDYVTRMSGSPPVKGVNVDEAVALGAAIYAAQKYPELCHQEQEFTLGGGYRLKADVMSHSLGMIAISEDGDRYVNSKIIPKNKNVPCEETKPYRHGESELDVYMTQGESDRPTDCTLLGKYHFSDISIAGKDPAVLNITYAYDINGVVQVVARQEETGRELPMRVEPIPEDMSWLNEPPKKSVAAEPMTVYLAFDLSGSMSGAPLAEAQKAAEAFVREIDLTSASIGLIVFADRVTVAAHATQDVGALNRAISEMRIGSVGYGNDTDPFREAQGLLKKLKGPRFIVVLADGVWSRQDLAIKRAKACHVDNIEVISIGFGGADKKFLQDIATSDEGSLFTAMENLESAFGTIAQELTSRSPEGSSSGLRIGPV